MSSTSSSRQPVGIYYLFLTEMWERFSYYGLTALLILYMAKTFGISDRQVYAIYGAYGALVYTTPILGGFIADRFIGTFRAIIYGGLLIAIGHFVLSIPEVGHGDFYLGLALIIVGTGLFMPNIAVVVGRLYERNDPRRDGGFTLAYVGRNLGTVIAPIICTYVAIRYSWNLAFSLAGIGMLAGLVIFIYGRKYFHPDIYLPVARHHSQSSIRRKDNAWFGVIVFAAIALIYFSLNHVAITSELLYLTGAFTLGLLVWLAFRSKPSERNAMLVVLILTFFYIVFKALLQQSGGMLNLFTERHVDRYFLGWNIPTGIAYSCRRGPSIPAEEDHGFSLKRTTDSREEDHYLSC